MIPCQRLKVKTYVDDAHDVQSLTLRVDLRKSSSSTALPRPSIPCTRADARGYNTVSFLLPRFSGGKAQTLIWTSNMARVLTFKPRVASTCFARRSLLLCLTAAHFFWNAGLSTYSRRPYHRAVSRCTRLPFRLSDLPRACRGP